MRRAPPFIHMDRSSSLSNACIVPTYAQTDYTSSGEVSFSFEALEVGKDRKKKPNTVIVQLRLVFPFYTSSSKRMMVRAGIHVLHVSHVYGRTNRYRTTNFNLPFLPHHSNHHLPPLFPRGSRRPHVAPHPDQDTRQDVGVAPPGAHSHSRCSSQKHPKCFLEQQQLLPFEGEHVIYFCKSV